MAHIEKTRIVTLVAACGLTTAANAVTLVYNTNTILTTAASVGVNSDPGFQVRNGATLTVNAGGSLTQADQAIINQTALLLGTTDGSESGFLVMNSGSSIRGRETGGNNMLGIVAYGSSVATINGGTIIVNENGNPPVINNSTPLNAVGFAAFGSSKFVLNGGAFSISENGPGRINPFTVGDNATVEINGGTWGYFADDALTTVAPAADVLGFVLSSNAQVKLNGTFNFGLGAIAANTGTITGTLANGDAFGMTFDKTAGGSITIIPEPRAALLGGLGTLALLRRRRA